MPSINDVFNEIQKTNAHLTHLSQQNETIICVLEHISKQTCQLLNEAHLQTGLQQSMEAEDASLLAIYKLANGQAAQQYEQVQALKAQLEKCCPPEKPEPICTYTPCPTEAPARGATS